MAHPTHRFLRITVSHIQYTIVPHVAANATSAWTKAWAGKTIIHSRRRTPIPWPVKKTGTTPLHLFHLFRLIRL